MQSKFGEWLASSPVSVDAVLRKDAMGIDLVARVPRGIPKHEWSLDVGDALHNLRSAFDAVAWGMAHFDDAQPVRPKSVSFPICTDEVQWQRALSAWVGDIHPELKERLRVVQPFTYAPAGAASVLTILHELDIQDKHREMLTVTADLQEINIAGSFEYEDHDTSAAPSVDMRTDIKFADGVVLGTINAGAPIRLVGQMILRPAMKVQLAHGGSVYDVVPMLQQLATETRRHLDILLFGLARQVDDDGGEWLPMNVGPSATDGGSHP